MSDKTIYQAKKNYIQISNCMNSISKLRKLFLLGSEAALDSAEQAEYPYTSSGKMNGIR
jgi:hypothetical protein